MTDLATGQVAGQASVSADGAFEVPNPAGQSIGESIHSRSALESALKAGLDVIDQNATVTFVKYIRLVLPVDGMAFWIRGDLVKPSSIINGSPLNSFTPNQAAAIVAAPQNLLARGSLHFTTVNSQNPDESFSTNRVVFTSKGKINDLNAVGENMMYIAKIHDFRFAFSTRSGFYFQADLYHYSGDAVYPVMEQLIIDDASQLAPSLQIISNSLPIWLTIPAAFPLFPSYLVKDNIRPPYCSIDIPPEATTAIQAIPYVDQTGSQWQLVHDKARLVFYGLTNGAIMDFYLSVLHKMYEPDTFGLMNSPAVRDEKRGQVELSVLALKKSMEFEVSYYQTAARDVYRQLIREAIPTFIVAD